MYPVEDVKRLAGNPDTFAMFRTASDDALGFGLDDDDVRNVLGRIDQFEFLKSERTQKYHSGTMSDYCVGFVEECLTRMFIKFLIDDGILVVTSFKEDVQLGD
jgi:hypothetical protein|tara:strand:- start:50 stop:358 length:309 start_codon:yes stop_codon:yes gene_type:complete